jgi:protein TonB
MLTDSNASNELELAFLAKHGAAHYLRMLIALLLGAASALSLAWFMGYLIESSEMSMQNSQRVQMLDFVRIKREENVARKDRMPERPQLNKAPEVPPVPQSQLDGLGDQLAVTAIPANISADIGQGSFGFGAGEGDYLPIVKVAPIYPQRAASRGISGDCLVMYTVTTAGTVKDAEVVKEECVNSVFYRSSVEAALRFKYKPRVVNGEPIEVRGVLNMFHYINKEAQ